MLLIDMKDLRSMLNYVSEHAKEYTTTYGNVSSQSVGAHPARAHRRRVRRGEIRCDSGAGIAHGEVR